MNKAMIGSLIIGGALAFGMVTKADAKLYYIPFNLTVMPNSQANYTGERYRNTSDWRNNFKVGVGSSTEGYRTYYSFRLEASKWFGWGDASRVVSAGPYLDYSYSPSDGSAEKKSTRLKVANTERTPYSQQISGWWDEATGYIATSDSRRPN
ncbi:DUF2712 domain-containing protein [Leuconostoc gelidum subsp. gasicomitatum]|uniref:DUF2712 domain-containing protein n=1 Tax=Leuconostoc gasicomitatum TaxID=115778 RepID=UPI0007448B54|nr:DUF2712 domain-containing protein [Leuconostoc gasicomitatum]MBZ5953196.1 DUF2712 domain-containing protein [Leuconostoc gasicomitatum]MBZ5988546.1 DUF2712 domain-containing protein [Leuconostoc gasicomitatum]MBZ5990811.1 DUF2712 domain-containing protein [Leuconostoc gasicomitatum]CUR62702.1 DUF2712-containing protein [Leuconostoc gasicomitatum KG16-1]